MTVIGSADLNGEDGIQGLGNGVIIAVEGPDGSGKDVVIGMMADFFRKVSIAAESFSSYDSTDLGKQIRKTLLSPTDGVEMHPDSELLLIYAAHMENIYRNVLPALQKNKVVILNRYSDSAYVYQHQIKGARMGLLNHLNAEVISDITPMVTFNVAASLDKCLERLDGKDKDKHEALDREFHEKAWAGYNAVLSNSPFNHIFLPNNTDDLEQLRENVEGALIKFLQSLYQLGFISTQRWLHIVEHHVKIGESGKTLSEIPTAQSATADQADILEAGQAQ